MRLALLAALAGTMLATPAFAQDRGFYAGIEAGLLFPLNNDLHVRAFDEGESVFDGDVVHTDYDSHGFDGDVLAGYDFGMFRIEGELGLKRAGHNRYDANESVCGLTDCGFVDEGPVIVGLAVPAAVEDSTEFDAGGRTRSWSFMVNALLDFNLSNDFRAYVGPGIGYHSTKITYDLDDPFDLDPFRISDHGLAMQGIAGIAYRLTPQLDLGLKYRYFRTSRLEEDYSPDAGIDVNADTRFKSHSILASLIYNFAAPMAPPPPPPPPPPPAPEPAPATQTCMDGSVILATDACPPPPPPPPAPERG